MAQTIKILSFHISEDLNRNGGLPWNMRWMMSCMIRTTILIRMMSKQKIKPRRNPGFYFAVLRRRDGDVVHQGLAVISHLDLVGLGERM